MLCRVLKGFGPLIGIVLLMAFMCGAAWAKPAKPTPVLPEPAVHLPRKPAKDAVPAPPLSKSYPGGLPILLREIDAELDAQSRALLTETLLTELRRYPELKIVESKSFRNQLGFARQNNQIACQLPEDCEAALRAGLGLTYELVLAIVPRADGQLNLRLKLLGGEAAREFLETVPDMAVAQVVLKRLLPDLLGFSPNVRADEGVVHVTSMPLGAQVFRNASPDAICTTPCSFAWPAGEAVELRIQRADHPPLSERVKVARGQVQIVSADLMTRQGELLVDSMPSGATVLIDGTEAGTTPLIRRNILAGPHKVGLRLPPFPEGNYEVTVKADETARVRHGFTPENGTLSVKVPKLPKKGKAEIYLNGIKVAESLYRADLLAGKYSLAVVVPGHQTVTEAVEVEAGKELEVVAEPVPGLSLKPGETPGKRKDYRPGGFSLGVGAMAVGFGAGCLTYGLREHNKGLIAGGAVAGGLGLGASIAGIVLLVRPPLKDVAIAPVVDTKTKTVGLLIGGNF